MNRFTTRASITTRALAICGLIAAAALAGCGTGQLSQTAMQEPAVNGSSVTLKNIALRDIRIRAVQTSDALRPGKTVDLVLVATNQSPDIDDTLVDITTDIGQVTVTGNASVPPSGALIVSSPDREEAAALQAVLATNTAKATVTLTKPISNGLAYDFTFRFARVGEATVSVPISAGTDAPRQDQMAGQGEQGEHGEPH